MRKNLVIAIDGYSSCGKSTLAKALAKKLHFVYVDSGAMYRAVTLYFLNHEIDCKQEAQVLEALSKIEISFYKVAEHTHLILNGVDVSEDVRSMHISENVSEVSALKPVRIAMVKQQQELGLKENIVMDGRDIGTTVFPDAQVKFFMTADPKVRAERRFQELRAKGNMQVSLEEVFENLAHRDYADTTRLESPLVRADDAIILDNTNLSEQEQLQFALDKIQPHLGAIA